MADDQKQQEPDRTDPQGAQEPPQEPQGGEGSAQPDGGKDAGAEPPVTDSHGQPGINKERHDREVAELKGTIDELQKQLAEQAETKEGRDKLQKELDDVRAKMAEAEVTHRLEMAGCRNVKAAKALLGDYDGDVAKLKAGEPYLFDGKQTGSTGGRPEGAPSSSDERRKKAREAAAGNLTIKR